MDYNLTFDYVGILPRHLEQVPILAERLPALHIVVDHLGNPQLLAADLSRGRRSSGTALCGNIIR